MTDDSRVADDVDDERTTVVDRSAPERSTPELTAADDDHEGTVVVDRSSHEPARDDDDDRTTVVERSTDAASASADGGDNATVVVERASRPTDNDNDNATIVVERAPRPTDNDNETIVVERSARPAPTPGADDPDGTIVVARASGSSKNVPPVNQTRRGRRRITLPPVEPGFGPDPIDAVGPGAIAAYSPRAIRPVPVSAPAVPLGPDATRAPAPSMPSVSRRSRAFGMIAVGGFALACAISVVGLGAIIASVVG